MHGLRPGRAGNGSAAEAAPGPVQLSAIPVTASAAIGAGTCPFQQARTDAGDSIRSPHRLLVFHRTSQAAADQILRSGFRDHTARYLTEREWTGVWVSDRPLDNSEGASGETLLQIEVAEEILAPYE